MEKFKEFLHYILSCLAVEKILTTALNFTGRGGARTHVWSDVQTEALLQLVKRNFPRLTGKAEKRNKVFAEIAVVM